MYGIHRFWTIYTKLTFQLLKFFLCKRILGRIQHSLRLVVRTANFVAFGSWSEALLKNAESLRDSDALMRVAVPRRRGPAGLRDPVAVPLTALIGFTILLSRIVAHRKLSACSLVTAVRFWNRCLRRSMRETYPLEQRSGCRF